MAERPSASVLQERAEAVASVLPPLLVAADRVAATVTQGVHGRRRVGQGEAFWQFRRYQPGDLPQRIDWRQSAKTQHAYIRENEWEAAQSVWIWRDGSPSMHYRSRDALPEKIERADLMTIALAALLVRAGERVALLGTGRRPATGQAALNRLTLQLLRQSRRPLSLPPIEPLPRHAHVVMIGDFLSPLPDIEALVRNFASQGLSGHLLQVVDPAEEALPFSGRVRFEGLEEEGALLLSRVDSVRKDYVRRFADHHAGLAAITRAVGWTFAATHTDRPPQTALLALYMRLSDRNRR